MTALELGIEAVERGLVPDPIVRLAIRRLCHRRSKLIARQSVGARELALAEFVSSMKGGPIAPLAEKANEQHYELPPEFFAAVLGDRRKYSCCYWPDRTTTLDAAEDAALAITCQRAGLADGHEVLELGCGWGSLSLWMAERYPNSRITAVSNSAPQRRFIRSRAEAIGLTNLTVITADMNDFDPARTRGPGVGFDRIVSVEMFEHMRNYDRLCERIASWLRPGGKCFVHLFCHRNSAYEYETEGAANWMGRHFFTGGIMPSRDLLSRFDGHLRVSSQWEWNGEHYRRTSNAWLANLDARRSTVLPILARVYGDADALRWLHRWRVFFMAVAEMFGCAGGNEWFVSHYLLEPVCHPVMV